MSTVLHTFLCYFYPRPPRGGRPYHDGQRPAVGQFLSTPSARRATPHSFVLVARRVFLSTPSARRATPLLKPPA